MTLLRLAVSDFDAGSHACEHELVIRRVEGLCSRRSLVSRESPEP